MASSNVPDDVASVCSVCLEPYKGRNPKILPCFHTLCLPCLKDLEKHHKELSPDTTVSKEDMAENKPLTFPCPTCRAVIKVPAGGVTQFQSNFYLKNNAVTCDVCGRGEDAVSTCTECGDNMCVTCQRYHNKYLSSHQVQPLNFNCKQASKSNTEPVKAGTITEHLAVLEEVLVTMREEEDTLQRERQAMADVISRRADAVMALVTQAKEKSQRALVEVAESLGKQIQEKIITVRDRYCRIWQLSSQEATIGKSTFVPRLQQTALLTDDDVQMYKQQCSRGRQLQTLLHQSDDSVINMQVIEAYIGTVSSGTQCTGEDSSSLLSAVTCSETRPLERQVSDTLLTSLPSDMTNLTRDIADMKDKLAALETVSSRLEKQKSAVLQLEALKEENSNLQSQVVSLREVDCRMQQNMDAFQHNMKKIIGDISKLQKDIPLTSRPSDMTKLARDIADINDKLAALETITSRLMKQQTAFSTFEALKGENSNLQSQVVSLREADSRMQQNMVAFQQMVEKSRGDILNLQKDRPNMKHKLRTINAINLLQNDVDSSQQESLLIKTETKKLQEAAEELSKGFKTFRASSLVAFNARLHEDSPADFVILREVDCNVGQAYDDTTGIFTVPVTGIYFFMARAMTVEEPEHFYLQILVDDNIAAMSGFFCVNPCHGMNYTVRLVKRLMKGQKVRLSAGCHVNFKSKVTSFCGVLMQPDINIV